MRTTFSWTPFPVADKVQEFRRLRSATDVADLLQVSFARLSYHLRSGSSDAYRRFHIPKKSGKPREIVAPVSALKIIQRKLGEILYEIYEPKASVHGFVNGRSILSNARMHCRQRWLLNLDLLDFFPSIHFGRVRGMFEGKLFGFNREVATTLARICCFESKLPQGAPTSPIVSNLICSRLDAELRRIAEINRCIYTRYADDVVFSTAMDPFPTNLAKLVAFPGEPEVRILKPILDIIRRNGFQVNVDKTRLRARHRRQEVTGLTVNNFPNVRKAFIKKIGAMLHAWETYEYIAAEQRFHERYYRKTRGPDRGRPTFARVLGGMIEFVGMVRGKDSPTYVGLRARYDARRGQTPHEAVWVLESAQHSVQGTGFTLEGVGIVTCHHVVKEDTQAWKAKDQKAYKVSVIAQDKRLDLAILTIENEPLGHALRAGDSRRVQQSDSVTVLGFPNYSFGQSVQELPALVTGFKKLFGVERFLVSSAILKGYSGGPVLNWKGEVVGIAASGADPEQTDFVEYGVIKLAELNNMPR